MGWSYDPSQSFGPPSGVSGPTYSEGQVLQEIASEAQTYGLDPGVIDAYVVTQSGFNPYAEGDPASNYPDVVAQYGQFGGYTSFGLYQMHEAGALTGAGWSPAGGRPNVAPAFDPKTSGQYSMSQIAGIKQAYGVDDATATAIYGYGAGTYQSDPGLISSYAQQLSEGASFYDAQGRTGYAPLPGGAVSSSGGSSAGAGGSSSSSGTTATLTGFDWNPLSWPGAILGKLFGGVVSDAEKMLIRIGLLLLGLVFIVIGIAVTFRSSPVQILTNTASPAGDELEHKPEEEEGAGAGEAAGDAELAAA